MTFVNGFGPVNDRRAFQSGKAYIAAGTTLDFHAHKSPAATILGVRKAAEVAAAAKIAIAKFIAAALERPLGHCRRRHHVVLLLRLYLEFTLIDFFAAAGRS